MRYTLLFLICSFFIGAAKAQFSEASKNYKKYEGFFDFYYDDDSGKVYLEVPELEKEFLYVYALSSGIGNNDIGLDRGQLGIV